MRHHPRGRALEDVQPCDLGLDRGHELDRGRAGADACDALAGDVMAVVPAGGVEDLAPEAIEAGHVGDARLAQRAHAGDQHARADRCAGGLDAPAAGVVVPRRLGDRRSESDRAVEVVRARSAPGRRGSPTAASRSRSSRDSARTRRSTGATERRTRSRDTCWPTRCRRRRRGARDEEVVDALSPQADPHAEAGEAGADDPHAEAGEAGADDQDVDDCDTLVHATYVMEALVVRESARRGGGRSHAA